MYVSRMLSRINDTKIEKTSINSSINARTPKDIIAIPISLFFSIFHPLSNRINLIINFWRSSVNEK